MREEVSEQVRIRELTENKQQILDNWLQEPTVDVLFHVPRRSGASTMLRQAVETYPGFEIEQHYPGLDEIVYTSTGTRFCMGSPTPVQARRYASFCYVCGVEREGSLSPFFSPELVQ